MQEQATTETEASESPAQKRARAESLAKREAQIQEEAEAAELERANQHVNEYRGGPLRFAYQVAPRRKVKTKLVKDGFLESGAEVKPEYVGGQATLDNLVRGGSVLKRA
jgi:hypothetical protein